MPLEREDIVRTDFPVERRGYAPEVVDRHLERIASEAETLRREGEKKGTSLAGTAGQRVQAIVDAAESTAAEIETDARDEAARIRDGASRQAKEHVAEVRSAANALRGRIDELEGELGTVFDELRANVARLNESLVSLEREAGSLSSPASPATNAPATEALEEPAVETIITDTAPAPAPEAAEEGDVASEDAQNARLVALNMALNGASRNETERYLAENFSIGDATELLDDVYAQRGV